MLMTCCRQLLLVHVYTQAIRNQLVADLLYKHSLMIASMAHFRAVNGKS